MHFTVETVNAILFGLLKLAGGVLVLWVMVWLAIRIISAPFKLFK